MSGLPWYALWTEFPTHGKTLALAAALRDDNAGMYVIRLWSHCANQALDGRIQCAIVESVAGWKKKRGVLLDALQAIGFLESTTAGHCIVHGWEERNGSRIRKALTDAKKPRGNKRASRHGPAAVPRGTDGGSSGGDVRSETETNGTIGSVQPQILSVLSGGAGGINQ